MRYRGPCSSAAPRQVICFNFNDVNACPSLTNLCAFLQSAASGYDTLDEDSIYAVTGNPRPEDIRVLLAKLLKESFESGYIRESGAAITCREIVKLIMPVVHDDSCEFR